MTRTRSRRRACIVLAALVVACGSGSRGRAPTSAGQLHDTAAATRADPPLWVLSPHPDDESLMAAEIIASAVRAGRPIFVHVMTNGDLGCARDGWRRQDEAVAAMGVLGLPERQLRFLGYPDGWLDALGAPPLAPLPRRLRDGSCGQGATTYGARGEGGADVHTARTGAAGAYTAESAIDDLARLLERDRPSDVYVSHPIDDHPDHATTYVLLRRSLERAQLTPLPRVHRALVHVGGCWPNGSAPAEPCPDAGDSLGTPFPPLPPPLEGYVPDERVRVADGGALARRAIAEHRSQLHTDVANDWLGDFARGDAIFWSETLMREGDRVIRAPAPGRPAGRVGAIALGGDEDDPEEPGATRAVHTVAHEGAFRLRFEAEVPDGSEARVHVFASDESEAAGYSIEVLGDRELEVRRADGRVLRRVAIPDDGARHARHRWEVRFDPRADEGDVLELEVRSDGALLAVMIDAEPFVRGDRVIVRRLGAARVSALALEAER